MAEHEAMDVTLDRAQVVVGETRTIAVLGVSRDPEKYGHKVSAILREHHRVHPINPKLEEIDGRRCSPSLDELPEPPESIVLALGPAVTEKLVPSCLNRGGVIWLPTGCCTEPALELARAGGMEVLAGICPVSVTRSLEARRG